MLILRFLGSAGQCMGGGELQRQTGYLIQKLQSQVISAKALMFDNMLIQEISISSYVLSPVLNARPVEMKETQYLMPKKSVLIEKTFTNHDADSSLIAQNDMCISSSLMTCSGWAGEKMEKASQIKRKWRKGISGRRNWLWTGREV